MIATATQFKQTEIGLIPEDWECVNAEKYIDFITGFPFKSESFSNSGIKLLRGSNVKRNYIDWSSEITRFWNELTPNLKEYKLKSGDIVISMDGSLVGKSFGQISEMDLPALLVQRVARIRGKNADINFLKHLYCSELFTKHCENNKTVSAIPHISPKDIKEYKIAIPKSIKEQQAIAEALSDADAWIESLEKLIAKKRLIKQGAMQELLSPKEDWEVKKLGEVIDFKNGAAHENVVDKNGNYVIVNSKFISQEGKIRKYSNAFLCPLYKDEIVMVMSDIPNGKALAKCYIIEVDNLYTLNQRICSFKVKEEYDSKFLYFKINRNDYFLSFDSGSGQTNLRKDEVLNCPIAFPKSKTEQTRIATILSDMDAELDALEQQLEKARQIKQGMMQELLTGRIRLV